jgi:hypothetical protein
MKGNQMVEPTAEDWIIVRLLVISVRANPTKLRMSADVIQSILFLEKKLGAKQLYQMLDELGV